MQHRVRKALAECERLLRARASWPCSCPRGGSTPSPTALASTWPRCSIGCGRRWQSASGCCGHGHPGPAAAPGGARRRVLQRLPPPGRDAASGAEGAGRVRAAAAGTGILALQLPPGGLDAESYSACLHLAEMQHRVRKALAECERLLRARASWPCSCPRGGSTPSPTALASTWPRCSIGCGRRWQSASGCCGHGHPGPAAAPGGARRRVLQRLPPPGRDAASGAEGAGRVRAAAAGTGILALQLPPGGLDAESYSACLHLAEMQHRVRKALAECERLLRARASWPCSCPRGGSTPSPTALASTWPRCSIGCGRRWQSASGCCGHG
ncbi:uncharacterized protein [Anas platyrhynchos]|uniref:uncharacterized protein n=1 Tax=Anas platyrhynchos TaxID=8839 RepID=UPI003AF24BF0